MIAGLALLLVGCRHVTPAHPEVEIMAPHEGERLWSFHAGGDELGSGGELQIYVDHHTHPHARASFAKYTLGVGGALPIHRHDKTEEFAYVLSGEGAAVQALESGGEVEIPIAPGYVWYNPPGVWHSMRNKGTTPLTIVFAIVPNEEQGLLSFFRKVSVKPGEDPIEIAPDELRRLAAEHDMHLQAPDEE
jgi:mannose-6-phosphate isomerase-like protein (cupin superfamily)